MAPNENDSAHAMVHPGGMRLILLRGGAGIQDRADLHSMRAGDVLLLNFQALWSRFRNTISRRR
jgi:hypothetical protein